MTGNLSAQLWRRSDRPTWLVRHFIRAILDFGVLTSAGTDSLTHMLLGAIGGLVALGFATSYLYLGKYARLWSQATAEPYRRAVLGDDLFIIGLPMLMVAFVTLLVSHSLFPDERDFRILGPLPVRRATVFGAKLTAQLLFTGAIIAVTQASLIPLVLLTSINRWREHAVLWRLATLTLASVMASAFTVFAVTAIVGALVLPLSRTRLHALAGIVRSTLLAILVLGVPFVFRLPNFGPAFSNQAPWLALLPSTWFVGLERVLAGSGDQWDIRLTLVALAAATATVAVVAITYMLLFRNFERFMARSAPLSSSWRMPDRLNAFSHATPAFRGVHRFTVATLGRSELHQGVLVAFAAAGVGMAIGPLMDDLTSAALWMPFSLMFVCGLGARMALVLPFDPRANWIFRMTEDEATRSEQLRAVDRVASAYVVGVPALGALPILWLAFGLTAIVATVIVALVGLVFVHVVLLDWRRIPFTCSYLPGKRFVAQSLVLGLVGYLLFTRAGVTLLRKATGNAKQAMAIAVVMSLLAYLLRRRRLATWSARPLMFEDEIPDQPLQLRL